MKKDGLAFRFSVILDALLLLGAVFVCIMWIANRPLFYVEDGPVMSIFTAFSLLLMAGARLARKLLFGWPTALTLAVIGLVLGGNVSSMLIHLSMPPELLGSFNIVLTSVMTSIGLALFCLYELLIALRETPQSALIFDDILLHLALVPGGLSLLGVLLSNPTYISEGSDPRVGISLLEMAFMGTYAVTAVLANRHLFLWQFLKASYSNRIIFAALFANQFIAPVIVAYAFRDISRATSGPGLELFVLLAGVITTVSFLAMQAFLQRRSVPVSTDI
ncbi:MAG: hypothetical protein KDK23_02295 [Leptospiraceae bacterium]|nr:hypothetical protein [Leptospiraceae bacterium]